MEQIPVWIPLLFILTTALTVYLFYKAAHFNKTVLIATLGWLALQTAVSLAGFYHITSGTPPRFLLLTLPPLIATVLLLLTKKGRHFLDSLDAKMLTRLHIVRIPVELVLYSLFIHQVVPKIMTFEGQNMDILSGLTAPVMVYLVYHKKWLKKTALLIWNIACLALLANIVVTALLSAPFPFQKFGFEQPNIAILYFPYTWLPGGVVPIVLLSHLAAIKQITKRQ
jgi:hypothetical protein